MKITVRKFWLLAAIGWCLVIFMFSSATANVSAIQSSSIKDIINNILSSISNNKSMITDFTTRKAAHFFEYTILGALFVLSFYPHEWRICFIVRSSLFCLVISIFYACTDEFHQYFVSGRAMRITDVLIDSAGAFFGIIVTRFCAHCLKKRRRKRAFCEF